MELSVLYLVLGIFITLSIVYLMQPAPSVVMREKKNMDGTVADKIMSFILGVVIVLTFYFLLTPQTTVVIDK
jgi:hypothetical protein